MPSVVFNSHTASGGLGRTPLDDLMLHLNMNGLHLFPPNHLNREGAEKVNCNHFVQSREQRENILYSRINCPSSKCRWGESCNETGEKHQTVEETPGEKKESSRTTWKSIKTIWLQKIALMVLESWPSTYPHHRRWVKDLLLQWKLSWKALFPLSL